MKSNNKRPASLATRITLLVGATNGLCLIIVGLIVQYSIESHFVDRDTDELNVVAEAVNEAIGKALDSDVTLSEALASAVSGHHGIYFVVLDGNNTLIYSSPGPNFSDYARSTSIVQQINSHTLVQWTQDNEYFRGAAIAIEHNKGEEKNTFKVMVVSAMKFHQDFLTWFRPTLWSVIAIAAILGMLAARFAVHQGHKPLHNISERIQEIGSDKLDVRIDPDNVPLELNELVISFNDMLSRIEDVFQQLANFSADIAHELRTPITNLTTQTQVSVSKVRTVEEYREILYSNLEEYERLTKMINDMLWLAKTDNGLIEPAFEALDIEIEIQSLFDYFEAWAEEQRVKLKLTGSCEKILGDKSMIRRALGNLIANAIRHADSNSEITVHLSTIDNKSAISLENFGDTIPKNHLPKIFDRFYRVDPARSRDSKNEGIGLGLSITRSIVSVHSGDIEVVSEQGKTIFTVILPCLNLST